MGNIIQIKCGTCGKTITSEHIHGSIIYCSGCYSYKVLSDNKSLLKPVFYKIIRFTEDERYYREILLDYFCNNDKADIFNKMKVNGPIRRYYYPVREIRNGTAHYYVPLNESESSLYNGLTEGGIQQKGKYQYALHEENTKDLNVNDYRPIYIADKSRHIEILPIDVPIDKIDAMYGVEHSEMIVVKYLPVITLDTNLGKLLFLGTDNSLAFVNKLEFEHNYFCEKKTDDSPIFDKLVKTAVGTGLLAVPCVLLYGLYKLFTLGIPTGISFIMLILKGIGLAIVAGLVAIELGLLIAGLLIIIVPVPALLFCLFYHESPPKRPDRRKGRKIFHLS